ncbi:helix-turn-helix domain-containing protein [Pararhodobacter zhoushanensis]|uniref:Helix-turn-helix domain-containing protein n=1 Tax=Pararhodobacter zhoushanensis TaxID=2479545 RepID=A0ABT3GW30_9RHOB|nr:helix-turn-helix domain-containing protein [Pararhodobacter zhoushanensis]MCW1931739.1 helix-turn-helix domain-containing protein [Pararhodobacter zhoushanensis]
MSHVATSWAFGQRGLKPSAKLVLLTLADCHNPAHGCFPTQAFLASTCELNRDTVNVQLALLEERGLIRRFRSIDPRTKRQRPTRYKLAFEDDFGDPDEGAASPVRPAPVGGPKAGTASKPATTTTPKTQKAVSEIPAEPCRKNPESRVGKPDTNLVKEPVMEPCVGGAGSAHIREHFEKFWKAHPRPRDRNRAEKLFAQAVSDGTPSERLIRAAERYRAENKGNTAMYLAYADNWLEKRRWEDFPDDRATADRGRSLQGMAAFWAKTIKEGRHVPANGISPDVAAVLISSGAVSKDELRRLKVQF